MNTLQDNEQMDIIVKWNQIEQIRTICSLWFPLFVSSSVISQQPSVVPVEHIKNATPCCKEFKEGDFIGVPITPCTPAVHFCGIPSRASKHIIGWLYLSYF